MQSQLRGAQSQLVMLQDHIFVTPIPWSWRRVMFCGLLFLGGNVLKKALAKLFSSHFYKATHYDKMQDALRKVTTPVHISKLTLDQLLFALCCSATQLHYAAAAAAAKRRVPALGEAVGCV